VKYDWTKLKAKYLSGDYKDLKELADIEKINYQVVKNNATGWNKEKLRCNIAKVTKITEKTIEKIAENQASRNARIFSLTDRLADKLEKAIEQLEQYIVTNKTKTKTIEYDNKLVKPTKEVVVEEETKEVLGGIVDRQGLKFLTAALKDIRDIQTDKQGNANEDAVSAHNSRLTTLAGLLNNPQPDRHIDDFEE
jgi:predicted transcriptional regulator